MSQDLHEINKEMGIALWCRSEKSNMVFLMWANIETIVWQEHKGGWFANIPSQTQIRLAIFQLFVPSSNSNEKV